MTDLRVGLVVQETLLADSAEARQLRVGLVVRESLSRDYVPPTDVHVGLVVRESLSRDLTPPTDVFIALHTREALLIGSNPTPPISSAFELDNLLVIASPPTLGDDRVSLRWSDDAGASWSNHLVQSLGAIGEYYTDIQFRRLGIARSRVFELSWSAPAKTTLTGVWAVIDLSST